MHLHALLTRSRCPQGWVLLKYKPVRWWFEIVLIIYKVFVITVTKTLDSGEGNTELRQLGLLVLGAGVV